MNPAATGDAKPAAKVTRPHVRTNGGRYAFRGNSGRGNSGRGILQDLLQAKAESDRKNYAGKHQILRQLMQDAPDEFATTGDGPTRSVTHQPTKFQLHLPAKVVPSPSVLS